MSSSSHEPSPSTSAILFLWLTRLAGPLAALLVYALLSRFATDLSHEAKATAAIGTLMALWWMTEALPLPVTSLLPLVLFPLTGALALDKAAVPYANKYIFLYMGGFMLALAVEKCNLHRRIALLTVLAVGTSPARLVGGFMLATGFISMWMSNTATAVLMLPIGLSLVHLLGEQLKALPTGPVSGPAPVPALPASGTRARSGNPAQAFAVCMMLGIAYASSIGGVATLVNSSVINWDATVPASARETYGLPFRGEYSIATRFMPPSN